MNISSEQSTSSNEESPAQKQARLRRERREAKIKAGGSARLDKITQLSGRAVDQGQIFTTEPPDIQQNQSPSSADTNDAGTSNKSARPNLHTGAADSFGAARNLDNTELRHNRDGQPVTGFDLNQQPSKDEDPMMRMLQQMIGGLPNDRANAEADLPSDLAAMLGGSTTRTASGTNSDDLSHSNANIWKIVHALSALALGVYIIMTTSFNGTRFLENKTAGAGRQLDISPRLFWIFATAEVILQSSRFFLDRGKSQELGWLGILARNLPEPARSYAKLVLRYCGIWTTTVADAMIVVFILGCVAWWKGAEG
ncbi:MAG: hypothetical protein Q9167_001550 [Letrouitia subvulpina]